MYNPSLYRFDSFTVLSISSIRSKTLSSKASLSSNSLASLMQTNPHPTFETVGQTLHSCMRCKNYESACTCQSHFTMHKCIFNELVITIPYPSKMPKKYSLHSCDCTRCKRPSTFSYSTVRRHRMIYGVEIFNFLKSPINSQSEANHVKNPAHNQTGYGAHFPGKNRYQIEHEIIRVI